MLSLRVAPHIFPADILASASAVHLVPPVVESGADFAADDTIKLSSATLPCPGDGCRQAKPTLHPKIPKRRLGQA